MKPIVFTILAVMFYAFSNVILEQKLAKFNNLTIIISYLSIVLLLAVTVRCAVNSGDPSFAFPTGNEWSAIICLGVVIFIADYFFIGAYTNGGNLFTITAIMATFPVFASVFRLMWVWETPNIYQISGYLLTFAAVLMITKGSS